MKFRLEPVRWLTVLAVVLGGALEVDREYQVLPAGWGHWVAAGAAFVALLLVAARARGAVTPVAAPMANEVTRLVPEWAQERPPRR